MQTAMMYIHILKNASSIHIGTYNILYIATHHPIHTATYAIFFPLKEAEMGRKKIIQKKERRRSIIVRNREKSEKKNWKR